jgi:hypothetical protein
MPIEHALVIAKDGAVGDVESLAPKDRAFDSRLPCLKILQLGKVSAVDAVEITFSDVIAFPLVILVFKYVSSTGEYSPIEAEFDSTKLYLVGGGSSGDLYYYFICYA